MRRLVIAGFAALVLDPGGRRGARVHIRVAGQITSTSAVLWTRSNEPGTVRLRVWNSARKGMPTVQMELTPNRAHDLVVQPRVHGLLPNRRYTYDFSVPFRTSRIVSAGEFRTAPLPSDSQTSIRFAVSGDADGTIDPKTGKPAYNVFQVYGRMAAERITSTSISATRSIRTVRSAACRPR